MEEHIYKLESKLYSVETKLNILTAWLQWRFHGDPSFPVYLFQDGSADRFHGPRVSCIPFSSTSVSSSNGSQVHEDPVSVGSIDSSDNVNQQCQLSTPADPPSSTTEKLPAAPPTDKNFCQECNREFHTIKGYRRHNRMQHPEIPASEKIKVRRDCPECQLTFRNRKAISEHLARVHNKRPSGRGLTKKVIAKFGQQELCAVCGKVFRNRRLLLAHRSKQHEHDAMRGIKQADMYHLCPICNRGILGAKFTIHMKRRHPGVSARLLNGGKVTVNADADCELG